MFLQSRPVTARQPDGSRRAGAGPGIIATAARPRRCGLRSAWLIAVPRDLRGSFEPQIVPNHARRLEGFDEVILSLYAKGLTTGEIAAHLAEIFGTQVPAS